MKKRKNPKYTHEFTDQDGKPRYYLRVPGRKRFPLPGLPWSPEFMEARERALKEEWVAPQLGASRTKAGTVNAAIVSYYQSSAFTDGLPKALSECAGRSWSDSGRLTATSALPFCTRRRCRQF